MGAKELRGELAARRIWEGVIATVLGGLIVWFVTNVMSRATPTTEHVVVAQAGAVPPMATSAAPMFVAAAPSDDPASRMTAKTPVSASIPGPPVAAPAPKTNVLPNSVPLGSVLLYENFARYREGDATDWGPNALVKTGLDHRNWLVPNVEGTQPVARGIRLPNEFYFECRYSAYMPEVTRGLMGFWKDPVSTQIAFLGDQGARYSIEWVIKYGNDPARINPLVPPSQYAKKYYHTIRLPDGTNNEIGSLQPTGMLRIDRDNNVVKVFIDGQAAVVGTISPMGQLVGFEIDIVKSKNGTLSFTDFKIAR